MEDEHVVAAPNRQTALIYSELACDLDELHAELESLAQTYAVRLAFPKECGHNKGAFLASLPQGVSFTPLQSARTRTLAERAALQVAKRHPSKVLAKTARKALEFERKRLFGDARFDTVAIHDGSQYHWLVLMGLV